MTHAATNSIDAIAGAEAPGALLLGALDLGLLLISP